MPRSTMPEIPVGSLRFPAVVSTEELKCTLGFCLPDRSHLDAALGVSARSGLARDLLLIER
jgi:hypothetical protein